MSWIAVGMIGSSVIGGVGNYLTASQANKGKYNVDPYGALNPDQKTLSQKLGPYLSNRIGTNAPSYTGSFTADMTPEEIAAMQREGRLAALGEGWSNQFQPGQINPEVDANELRNLNQQFYGNGATPGAKALAEEQYAGSGGYWGSARAGGVMNAYNNTVVTPYQNWRSKALQDSYTNSLNYMSGMNTTNQTNAAMQAVPRLIKQYGLEQQYNEWVRGQGENTKYIDQALNFLNLSTGTTNYQAANPSLAGTMTSSIGSGLSNLALINALKGSPTTKPSTTPSASNTYMNNYYNTYGEAGAGY